MKEKFKNWLKENIQCMKEGYNRGRLKAEEIKEKWR
jgi:hypothetical protein